MYDWKMKTNIPVHLLVFARLLPKLLFEENEALESVAEDLFFFLVSGETS